MCKLRDLYLSVLFFYEGWKSGRLKVLTSIRIQTKNLRKNFRNVLRSLRNLNVDTLSFIPQRETKTFYITEYHILFFFLHILNVMYVVLGWVRQMIQVQRSETSARQFHWFAWLVRYLNFWALLKPNNCCGGESVLSQRKLVTLYVKPPTVNTYPSTIHTKLRKHKTFGKASLLTLTNDLFVILHSKRLSCIILHFCTKKKVSAMKRC